MPVAAGPGISYSPDLTGAKIIKRAMRLLGALGSGGAVDPQEFTDGLEALNDMLDAWNNEGLNIFSLNKIVIPLTVGVGTYTIGIGGDIDAPRPPTIDQGQAYLLDGDLERPLYVMEDKEWYDISFKGVTGYPALLHYDHGFPLGTINILALPDKPYELILWLWNLQPQLTSKDDVFSLPPGYSDAIKFNLALRLVSEYGKGKDADLPPIIATAQETKANLKRLNSKPGLMSCDPAYLEAGQFDIYTGGIGGGGSALPSVISGTPHLEIPAGVIDGLNVTFAFTGAPTLIFLNGLMQEPSLKYTAAGVTITMVTPPAPGDDLQGLVYS